MIVMWVNQVCIDVAIDRGFAATGPDAARMHLAYTHPEGTRQTNMTPMVKVTADPEAWDALAVWFDEQSWTPPGVTDAEGKLAAKLFRACRRIENELRKLANHPAYRGVGVMGVDRTVLPARRCGEGRWWPTRRLAVANSDGTTMAVTYAELVPESVFVNRRKLTRWELRVGEAAATEPGRQ